MGYYTDYDLTISCATMENGIFRETSLANADPARCEALKEELRKLNVFDDVCVNQKDKYGGGWCNAKWYDCEADMIALSARFPEFFFALNGNGEEQGDMWNAYFFSGMEQMCRAEIRWPQFDPKELKMTENRSLLSPNYQYSYQ